MVRRLPRELMAEDLVLVRQLRGKRAAGVAAAARGGGEGPWAHLGAGLWRAGGGGGGVVARHPVRPGLRQRTRQGDGWGMRARRGNTVRGAGYHGPMTTNAVVWE